MSNHAGQDTDSKKQIASDAASFTTTTSTLYDGKDSTKTKKSSPKSSPKGSPKTDAVPLDDSATSFAKKAKKEGWSSPTATRPSLSG